MFGWVLIIYLGIYPWFEILKIGKRVGLTIFHFNVSGSMKRVGTTYKRCSVGGRTCFGDIWIFARFTWSFANPSFQDLMGSHIMYWDNFKSIEVHSWTPLKILIFLHSSWDLSLRFSENAVLFHIEWLCRKTAGNVNRPPLSLHCGDSLSLTCIDRLQGLKLLFFFLFLSIYFGRERVAKYPEKHSHVKLTLMLFCVKVVNFCWYLLK